MAQRKISPLILKDNPGENGKGREKLELKSTSDVPLLSNFLYSITCYLCKEERQAGWGWKKSSRGEITTNYKQKLGRCD